MFDGYDNILCIVKRRIKKYIYFEEEKKPEKI